MSILASLNIEIFPDNFSGLDKADYHKILKVFLSKPILIGIQVLLFTEYMYFLHSDQSVYHSRG